VLRPFDLPEALEENLISHLTVWCTVGLLSAILSLLLYGLLEHTLRSPALALLLVLAYALGTIAFPFSTLFFSHQIAAALVFLSFGLLFLHKTRLGEDPNAAELPAYAGSPWILALAGFCAGFALTTEYPTMIAVAPISLYALLVVPQKRHLLFFFAGLGLGGGLLVLYNLLAFGKIYMIPYSVYGQTGSAAFPEHRLGYMGVRLPSWEVIKEITIRPTRGLLYINPWLALVVPAFLIPVFSRRNRKEAVLCTFIILAFLAFNAGYGKSIIFWGGGASVGPRHVVPMLPFAVFLLAPLTKNRFLRYFFYVSSLASVAIMLMATATEPRVPYEYKNPAVDLFWDGYVTGRLAIHHDGPFSSILLTEDSVSFNLGKLFGLPPRFQLLPLFLFWFLMLFRIVAVTRRRSEAMGAATAERIGQEEPRAESTPASPLLPKAVLPVAGAYLVVLFALPFFFGNLEVRRGGERFGLRGIYAKGVAWEALDEAYRPMAVPEEQIVMRRVDEFLLFPWHHDGPPIQGPFSVEWTGWIYIPKDGHYKFATASDDGSSVYIDDRLVVDNWGIHGRRRRHKGVDLKQGFHTIVVRYYNVAHKGSMYFLWARPGTHLQPVPKEHLFPEAPGKDS
jgi:hypothetical protein